MGSVASIIWGMLFGAIGVGFFMYGKRQQVIVPLVCGLVLMIYPWFVTNVVLLVVIGIVLMAIPYFVRY